MALHTAIDAVSGKVLIDGATAAQFDLWYDHHSDYRKVRQIEEVCPDLRDAYLAAGNNTYYLIQD